MNDFLGLRIALVVVAWSTVAGGALLGTLWSARGGPRALGPDEELEAEAGVAVRTRGRRATSFSVAQVFGHGLLGVITAVVVTYWAFVDDDRRLGYVIMLGALAITAVPGLAMF